jgi:hypothetical protein
MKRAAGEKKKRKKELRFKENFGKNESAYGFWTRIECIRTPPDWCTGTVI